MTTNFQEILRVTPEQAIESQNRLLLSHLSSSSSSSSSESNKSVDEDDSSLHFKNTICVIGAGITGCEAFKVFQQESKYPVVILERSHCMGGIWMSSANSVADSPSTVQVDPVSFAPIVDTTEDIWDQDDDDDKKFNRNKLDVIRPIDPANPYSSLAFTSDEVLARLARHVEKFKIKQHTCFGVEVVAFGKNPGADGVADPVWVDVKFLGREKKPNNQQGDNNNNNNNDGEHVTFTRRIMFKELHIRIGNLLKPRATKFAGEEHPHFHGKSFFGVGGDIKPRQFKDKNVVICGSGAFAIENVRRAIASGAKTPVRVLTRSYNKCLFPEYATYNLRRTLNSLKDATEAQDNVESATEMWRKTVAIITKVATQCGMAEKVLNTKCIRKVYGESHVLFNGAIPPLSSNLMYLACYYGLVEYIEDEVDEVVAAADFDEDAQVPNEKTNSSSNVITKKHKHHFPCDLLVKCTGFDHNDGILEDHVINDAYFVDNYVNVTHNARGDRINGTIIFGPHVQCRNFLISYYEDSQDYERPIVRLNEKPEIYQEMLQMEPQRLVCDISMVDYLTTIFLSDKLSRLSDEKMRSILSENLERRNKMYEKFLPDEVYRKADEEYWNKLSSHFHKLSKEQKPFLAYPFQTI